MVWLDIIQKALVGGGVLYLLIDRFARTKEQKGSDAAQMIKQVAEAFEKTLNTVTTYTQSVIDKMREDNDRDDRRHQLTERRCEELERRLTDLSEDNELLKTIVNKAVSCNYLKTGNNKDCPVIAENQKRLKARCKAICRPNNSES